MSCITEFIRIAPHRPICLVTRGIFTRVLPQYIYYIVNSDQTRSLAYHYYKTQGRPHYSNAEK